MSFYYVFDNHILMLICRLVSILYDTFGGPRPGPLDPQNVLALVKKYMPITGLGLDLVSGCLVGKLL